MLGFARIGREFRESATFMTRTSCAILRYLRYLEVPRLVPLLVYTAISRRQEGTKWKSALKRNRHATRPIFSGGMAASVRPHAATAGGSPPCWSAWGWGP